VTIKRQAKPNREAKAIDAQDVCDIARLSQVRMWKAYDEIDSFRREREAIGAQPQTAGHPESSADQKVIP
jgi:hypothetical protein